MTEPRTFEKYEDVARFVLSQMKDYLGLEAVEGKQLVDGKRSGTAWEIDGKGVLKNNQGFLIIEARRYTTSKLSQESVAAIAYRIEDTSAKGAIIVTPLGLQKGAQLVGDAEQILVMRLNEEATVLNYVAQVLDRVLVGLSDTVTGVREDLEIEVRDATGKIVDVKKWSSE